MWINSLNGFNPQSISPSRHYCSHFKDGLAEAKGGKITCSESYRQNEWYLISVSPGREDYYLHHFIDESTKDWSG